jgi:rhodanese-related sulfurtransferase
VAIEEISVAELHALGPSARVIDVRQPEEWDAGRIAHAELVPLAEVPAALDRFDGEPTYVVCRVGVRSAHACEFVVANGGRAVNVAGGMIAWVAAGYDVETGGHGG